MGDAASRGDRPDVHVVVTGAKSRTHLVYVASYVRTLIEDGGRVRLSIVEAPAFLSAAAVTAQDARELLPSDGVEIEAGMPGWHFAPGARAVYVAVGSPGLRASLALRRANPRRRIECVVTDEGIGSYASLTSRRDAIARQGVPASRALARAALVVTASRLLTTRRWAAYERRGDVWRANPKVVAEFRREVRPPEGANGAMIAGVGLGHEGPLPHTDASAGRSRLAVILTQPFVDLGLCDESTYVGHVRQLAAAAQEAGLEAVVRPHPAERPGRYGSLTVMDGVGTAELDPAVVSASLVMGGPSTALVNLAAMFDVPTVWSSEPSLAYLDREVSVDQAAIFETFLGTPVEPADVPTRVRDLTQANRRRP